MKNGRGGERCMAVLPPLPRLHLLLISLVLSRTSQLEAFLDSPILVKKKC